MNKSRIFILVLVLMIALVFLLTVYQVYRPNTTQIMTGDLSAGQQSGDAEGRNNNGFYQKGRNAGQSRTKSSTSNGKDAEDDSDSDEDVNEIYGGMGGGEDYRPDNKQNQSNGNGNSDGEGSNGGASQPNSNDGGTSSPSSGNSDFSKLHQAVQVLRNEYAVAIAVSTPDTPIGSQKQYHSADTAMDDVKRLGSVLKDMGGATFQGLNRRGYAVSATLLPGNGSSAVNVSKQGNGISLSVYCDSADWSYAFCVRIVAFLQEILQKKTSISTLYDQYHAINPKGFSYGTANLQYVRTTPQQTYFLSVEDQSAVSNDFRNLYSSFLTGRVASIYCTSGVPLYQKIQFIKSCIAQYIH